MWIAVVSLSLLSILLFCLLIVNRKTYSRYSIYEKEELEEEIHHLRKQNKYMHEAFQDKDNEVQKYRKIIMKLMDDVTEARAKKITGFLVGVPEYAEEVNTRDIDSSDYFDEGGYRSIPGMEHMTPDEAREYAKVLRSQ